MEVKRQLKYCFLILTVLLFSFVWSASKSSATDSSWSPYEVTGTGSKFFDLEIEKFDTGVAGPQVIAKSSNRLFVASRDSNVIRVMTYGNRSLDEIQEVVLPHQRDEQEGSGKYVLDLETRGDSDLFVSYLEWYDNIAKCDRVVVVQYKIKAGRVASLPSRKVFASTPCWTMLHQDSVRGGYTASGRMAVQGNSLYVEGGMVMIELGHNKYPNPGVGGLSGNFKKDLAKTNLFGSVTKVDLRSLKWKKLSIGHRNPQGLMWDSNRKILWSSEHGPSGGCELNIIREGKNYGWPFVSLGREYFDQDVLPENNVFKTRYGTHVGYELPAFAWNPSIGPSQLVIVPPHHPFGPVWTSDLLLSTLKDQSIYRIVADKSGRVYETERIAVGHRIRDLAIGSTDLWASTDDGKILRLTRFVPSSD